MKPPPVHPFLMDLLRGQPEDVAAPPSDDPAWQLVVEEAARHGLTPILYRWLTAFNGSRRALLERVKTDMFRLAARNLALAQELASILRALEADGVACMPLRGLALAEQLYGEITARPVGDLDLLVRKEDLPRVSQILRGLGFHQLDHRRGFAEAFSYTLVFLKEGPGWVIVEPHWSIGYPPFVERLDMQGVWGRAVRGRVAGVDTRLLGREDLLLHLCLHLAHPDGAVPLLWFYELDRLLREDPGLLDWSLFCSIVGEAGLEFLVAAVLSAVMAGFDTPVPDHVLDRLSQEPRGPVDRGLARLLGGGSGVDGREELAVFLTLKGFQQRLSYALGLLFPSPQFMRLQSGATGRADLLSAYVRRCCRLAWAGSRGVARLLR